MGVLRDIYTVGKALIGLDTGDDVSFDDIDVDVDGGDVDGLDSIDSDGWGVHDSDTFVDDSDETSLDGQSYEPDDSYNLSFQRNSSDSKNQDWYDYYKKKEQHSIDEETAHLKRAAKALENGDEHAYNDHISRAKSRHNDADKFRRSAEIYKNKI